MIICSRTPKKLRGHKRPILGAILDNYRLWRRKSLEGMAISTFDKRESALSAMIPSTFEQKIVNFDSLTTTVIWLMFTHPKSSAVSCSFSSEKIGKNKNQSFRFSWTMFSNLGRLGDVGQIVARHSQGPP